MLPELFGCVLFDDPHEHSSGFASTSKDARPSRISGTESLSTGCIWLTNLDYGMVRDSGFTGHSRFRRNDYFGGRIDNVAEMLGLRDDGLLSAYPQVLDYIRKNKIGDTVSTSDLLSIKSKLIASVFERVTRLSNLIFGINNLSNDKFNLSFRQAAYQFDPLLERQVATAITDATVYSVLVERNAVISSDSEMKVKVFLPPIEHAIRMLKIPVPSGEWRHYVRKRDVLKVVSEADRPFLAKVVLTDILPEFNRLLNFGSGSSGKHRLWVSSIELDYLKYMANVDIREVYISEYALTYTWVEQAAEVMAELKDKLDLSLSAGLMAKSLWTGFASKRIPKGGDRKCYANPVTPFVHSLDRQYCLMAAMELSALGHEVSSYGMGEVIVTVDSEKQKRKLTDDSISLGLLPSSLYHETPDFKPSSALEVFQKMLAQGEIEELMNIDNRVVNAIEGLIEND
jgi:hypothetical protein